ncbi:MAG: hypothetical protein RMJ59_00345 [Candidatus Nitrosocaldus sp.]|nr:hypothetical protein [Candidatus Nitrosocaldus sp.]MDW8274812.1 hypothetical protein [Candidatus Nitrosocaldus sp.]
MASASARAFAPGHITGFVEFPTIMLDDPLLMGSKGAGVCISKGITTDVYIYPASEGDDGRGEVSIYINGEPCADADVSLYVLSEYLKLVDGHADGLRIDVMHRADIPIGYGLGSSGAAALSLSYALNSALMLGLSREEAARIAHKADLACRCGAGTVIAEYHGGLEMRLKAGAPGVGVVESILDDGHLHDYRVLILCISPYPTKEFLTNRMSTINGLGGRMLRELALNRSIDTLLDLSYRFARSIDFITDRAARVIDALHALGCRASVALFGETVFTMVRSERADEVERVLAYYRDEYSSSSSSCHLLSCPIDTRGARLLDTREPS